MFPTLVVRKPNPAVPFLGLGVVEVWKDLVPAGFGLDLSFYDSNPCTDGTVERANLKHIKKTIPGARQEFHLFKVAKAAQLGTTMVGMGGLGVTVANIFEKNTPLVNYRRAKHDWRLLGIGTF